MPPTRFNPGGGFDVLEVRGAQVKVPALIAVASLKPDSWRLAFERGIVISPLFEIAIDRLALEEMGWGLEIPLWSVNANVFEEPNRFSSGQVTAFPIRRP
jgi:hypothetical protein